MRIHRAIPVLTTIATFAAAGAAQQDLRAGDQYRFAPVAFEAQLSPIGGPLGNLGAAVDLALIPEFSLAAGIGAGRSGIQWGATAKPRIPLP